MTSPQDQPRRRRHRGSRRAAGPEPVETSGGAAEPAGTGSAARAGAEAGAAGPTPTPGSTAEPTGSRPPSSDRRRAEPKAGRRDGSSRDSERGWRELAGSSPSQVGLGGALRARDVARPTAEDLAAAERSVVMVRRQWQPPEG